MVPSLSSFSIVIEFVSLLAYLWFGIVMIPLFSIRRVRATHCATCTLWQESLLKICEHSDVLKLTIDARRWSLSYACYSEMLNFIDYFSSFFSLLFSTFFLLTRETTFPAIWMTWSYYQSYSFRQKENLWVKLHPVEARFCMMAIHRGLRSTLSKAYPLVTPGKPLPHTNKMLVELSHVSWCHIKIMNADHATRFLPFRPALLLSHFTLVSFRITLVLFALALSVYFVFCFLCQILRENIEHCSGNLFQISFKH